MSPVTSSALTPAALRAAVTVVACSTVEQNITVCRVPAFSRQWRMTASVTGVWFMICPTAAMSKSSPSRTLGPNLGFL
jgi:hypothetical protein